jgi:hypothetical protein
MAVLAEELGIVDYSEITPTMIALQVQKIY